MTDRRPVRHVLPPDCKPSLIRDSVKWAFILGCVGVFAGPPLLHLYFVVADLFRGNPSHRGDPLVGFGEVVLVVIGSMVGVGVGVVAGPSSAMSSVARRHCVRRPLCGFSSGSAVLWWR